jgi:hypothetical protein
MRRLHARFVPAGAAALALLGTLFSTTPAFTQQQQPGSALPNPRLTVLTPAGGKAGTVVEVTFTGTDTEDGEALLFTHPNIKAEPVIPPPPPPPDPKKPPATPPAKAPITKFKVTVGADVPVGTYDARLVNKWGVSNPRAFVVGDLPEVLEKEPNNDVEQAQKIELNSVVHGAITTPTDVDYYVFPGKKGQRVIISCLASSIDSRLNAGLELYDGKSGRLLASNRRYNGSDALLEVTLADDGDYFVRVYEFTHTLGNAEHFYRLSVSTAPWIDAVFPPMIEPGKTAQVTVYGRNLPGGQPAAEVVSDRNTLEKITVSVTAPADGSRLTFSGATAPPAAAISGFEYRVRNGVGASNPFLISFAKAPVVLETEPNDKPETAQKLTLPCEVAGRIDKREDRDWYSFTAKKGEVYSIEVLSDRIGAPTDMKFLLRNPATKSDIIELDDPPPTQQNDAASLKFFARSEDPATYRFVVPADGDYQLLVSSQFGATQFGPRHYYRLRITPEQPDFQLIVMPTDHNRPDAGQVLQGGNEALTVYALRQDGFAGDIQLTVEGLPKGITCPAQTLGAGARVASLAFTAAADAPDWTGELKIKGTATIGGKPVIREARSATIVSPTQPQQNVPSITRLDRSLVMAVRAYSKAPFTLSGSLDKVTITQGEKANLTVKLTRNWPDLKQPINTILSEIIPNLTVAPVAFAPDKAEGTSVVTVAANTPPGTYTLVLRGTAAGVPYNKDPMAKQKPGVNVVQFSAPVTLTVLPKSLATVSVAPNTNVKVGATGEVVVKVTRLYEYADEFKVQVVLPTAVKGLTIADVVIPAGKDEAKLVLTVPADAMPGPRNDLVVKVTANWNGNVPVVHEAKFNVNVVK